jgi:YggT family protein
VLPIIETLDVIIEVVRRAFLAVAAVLFVVFGIDWLVRTRRINPFNPVARFFRRAVQPVIEPVEQRVLRAGGVPSSAPWWALVAAVIGGILVILGLQFVRDLIERAAVASQRGARGVFYLLGTWIFGILQLALIVRVIASWFRISEFNRWIRWSVTLTEPLLRPLRRVIPPFGMIDVTPLVAWFLLNLLQGLLLGRL